MLEEIREEEVFGANNTSESTNTLHDQLINNDAQPPQEITNTENTKDQQKSIIVSSSHVKWWVWVILVLALLAMSSAATALRKLKNVPPLMKASWRLQCTSLILFVGFIFHSYKLFYFSKRKLSGTDSDNDPEFTLSVRTKYLTWKTFLVLFLSGTALAVHFGSWVASLNETSMAHSLLFVTCHPLVIVFGSLVLRRPISKGEVIGAVIGFVGLVITLLDTLINPSAGEDSPTVLGDSLAFVGSLAIIVYLYAGKNLRSWVSLYLYAFPVTFISAVWLGLVSLIFEKSPPSVISVTLLIEPIIGSFMGYFAGESVLPGLFTFIGGPIIIVGCILVTISSYKRSQLEISSKYIQLSNVQNMDDKLEDTKSEKTSLEMQEM